MRVSCALCPCPELELFAEPDDELVEVAGVLVGTEWLPAVLPEGLQNGPRFAEILEAKLPDGLALLYLQAELLEGFGQLVDRHAEDEYLVTRPGRGAGHPCRLPLRHVS